MHSSFIISVGRLTKPKSFIKHAGMAYLRRGLHYILIDGEKNFNKYNDKNPFWDCRYMDFDAKKIIKKIFKENSDYIVYVKTGDGPEGKFFITPKGKVDYKKIKIKSFEVIDQQFYKGKFPGIRVYGKAFGAGNDGD